MSNSWAPPIPGLWSKLRLVPAALLVCLLARAEPPADLLRAYRAAPSPAAYTALLDFAHAHPDSSGALAYLALATTEIDRRHFSAALPYLDLSANQLPQLADYTAYLTAVCRFEQGEYPAAEHALGRVWSALPPSPLAAKAAVLGANCAIHDNHPHKAISLVHEHLADLTVPEAEILLAHAEDLAGSSAAALAHYRRVLVEFPTSSEAPDAASDPARIASLPPALHLARCLRLIDANPAAAAHELTDLLPQLTGPDLDTAQLKLGETKFLQRDNKGASDYLAKLSLTAPEADAERLYYLIRCARRLDRPDDFQPALERLAERHPRSTWRLQALASAADYFWNQNAASAYRPLYRACFESFPTDPQATNCLWRYSFSDYRQHAPTAAGLFQTLVSRFPDSDKVTGSLYFLGRLSEAHSDPGSAKVYYQEIAARFPNFFYAVLARDRLRDPAISQAAPTAEPRAFLNSISWTAPPIDNFMESSATRAREQRAHLLASAGLDELAESELRFAAKHDSPPVIAALALAELCSARDAYGQSIRSIKQLAPHYLRIPLDGAPDKFWKLAFPIPYRAPLEQYSTEHGLDPYLVAALIRQESEFNPTVISPARAYGLTQILPSTGREIGRKLNLRGFTTRMLFLPEINLRIGTFYLRSLLDSLQGKWEATLASYNAGPNRVSKWLEWGTFSEPAEFIETIPFEETRNYVMSVLRNADLYRRLYGPKTVALASSNGNISGKDASPAPRPGKRAPAIP